MFVALEGDVFWCLGGWIGLESGRDAKRIYLATSSWVTLKEILDNSLPDGNLFSIILWFQTLIKMLKSLEHVYNLH